MEGAGGIAVPFFFGWPSVVGQMAVGPSARLSGSTIVKDVLGKRS